ncbi:MAG: hypothetical protein C0502_05215 [Opitutus sp.]|nr:hypothetical protein [Opitutus sp.]
MPSSQRSRPRWRRSVSPRRQLFGALLLLLCASRTAGLEWVSDRFEGVTAPLQTTLDVAFGFRNAGDRPATIRGIQTNCDCLRADANKSTFAPGETGVLTARFTVGDRIGLHLRTITVVTDDSPEPKRLLVRIEVPEAASATPNALEWAIGSAPSEKTVDVRAATGLKIDFQEASPSNSSFSVRLEAIEAGSHYRLRIAPTATGAAVNAAIRVKGTASTGQPVLVSAYANVR